MAPYPFGRVGSQRFRFEQYWDVLSSENQLEFQSFLSESDFDILYSKGNTVRKILGVLRGFLRRFFILFRIHRFQIIFIHREAAPLGPPFFEWIIAKVLKKRIIYDFDDAIWLSNTSAENKIAALTKCHWKVKYICKWAWKISCGNDFLSDYARLFNSNVVYIPTTLDLELVDKQIISKKKLATKLTIGWTGTHSTLKYLQAILPILQELENEVDFEFVVIADKNPLLPLKHFRFIPWKKATEWSDLAQLQIGLMPLGSKMWEEGKCGFKILQYMALGIPALASATNANQSIIIHNKNGFICTNPEEWKTHLMDLIQNIELKKLFAERGRKTLENGFSKKALSEKYIELLS